MSQFSPIEASISDIRRALDTGQTTAVELVQFYLDRIAKYDHVDPGERSADALAKANAEGRKLGLNSIPALSERVPEDAGACHGGRLEGEASGAGSRCTGYESATAEELPDATPVMDPFHVVALAGGAVERCRQRIQQETLGHRGRSEDPLYGIRRVLLTGANLLTPGQATGRPRRSTAGSST